MKFSRLQKEFKEKLDVDHLADIARELNVSPQAVSNWKARDRVPYKYVIKIREIVKKIDKISDDSVKSAEILDHTPSSTKIYHENIEDEYIQLTDILLIFARHIKIIVIIPIISFFIMLIHVQYFAVSVYIAKAKIMSSTGSRNVSQAAGLAAQFGINLLPTEQSSQWYLEDIVKSRTLAKKMLNRKFDSKEFGKQKPLLQILTNINFENIEVVDKNIVQSGINSVIGMINLTPNENYFILEVSASEPIFARDFIIALIEELDAHQREYSNAKMSETRQFIEARIVETEKALNTAEEALKNFRDRNRRIENSPSLLLEQQRLSREVSVLMGVFTTLKQQNETTKIEEVKESIYVLVLDEPIVPTTRSKPKKKFMLIISVIIGIILSISLSFVLHFFNTRNDEDQKKISQLKKLLINNIKGLIPKRKIID